MSVAASTPGGCPTCGQPTEAPIKASVGTGGKNINADVKIIQQMLNALKPIEGGPNVMLAEDGLIGPKTQAAITKYQKKALGWTDGRIDVAGPTIKALMGYLIDSPTALRQAGRAGEQLTVSRYARRQCAFVHSRGRQHRGGARMPARDGAPAAHACAGN